MLIQFTVGNFRSFKDKQTLSMLAANVKGPEECIRDVGKYKLLTSTAIYGANASGKSNLIQAMRFVIHFVLNSATNYTYGSTIPVTPFRLVADNHDKPSHFEFIFLHDGIQYRYGLEADAMRVQKELLYHTPSSRESLLFNRDNENITLRSALKGEKKLFEKTRANSLFLSVLAQFNNKVAEKIIGCFQTVSVMYGLPDASLFIRAAKSLNDKIAREMITEFLKEFDTDIVDIQPGYSDVKIENLPPFLCDEAKKEITEKPQLTPKTIHNAYDAEGIPEEKVAFLLEQDESDGTQKLFSLAIPILSCLQKGGVLIIDEMDARLHPIITESIIRLFQQRATNTHDAQLIFTTHDTNLLGVDLLRRDQVWFTEKDRFGATELYPLVEFKSRERENFEANYIQGRYGAIPFVGGVARLMDASHEE
jgi:AAA15 family ATPase/GTPase